MKQNSHKKGFLCRSGTSADLPEWLADYPEFHIQVKALRESLGISQQKLAEEVGLTWRSIPNIESGRVNPKISTLNKIAEQLDCDLKIFLIPRNAIAPSSPPRQKDLSFKPVEEKKDPPIDDYVVEKKKEYFWD